MGCKVNDGWYILSVVSGYYPYVVVADCRVNGFEVTAKRCRVIRRFGQNQSLSGLAKKGPVQTTQILEESPEEIIFRPNISRAIPTDPALWGM